MKEMSPQDAGGHTFPANDIWHIGLLVVGVRTESFGRTLRHNHDIFLPSLGYQLSSALSRGTSATRLLLVN